MWMSLRITKILIKALIGADSLLEWSHGAKEGGEQVGVWVSLPETL
jgi:hypothetical protein